MRSNPVASASLLAAVLVTALATTGACNERDTSAVPLATASETPGPTRSPADPMTVLVDAITKTRVATRSFTLETGVGRDILHGTGVMDPASRRQSIAMTSTVGGKTSHEQAIIIGADLYIKADDPPRGVSRTKWMHVGPGKFVPLLAPGQGDLHDPTGFTSYSTAVATAHRTGPGQYAGTLDYGNLIRQATADPNASITPGPFDAVPFTAVVTEDGWLSSYTITMPAAAGIPHTTVTVRFSGFGAPVTIQAPPAGETQEAPPNLFPG
jgi:hypothetical protein